MMKKLMLFIAIGVICSCGSSTTDKANETDQEVTNATAEKIKTAQDVNTELEEIDGELDSLMQSLN